MMALYRGGCEDMRTDRGDSKQTHRSGWVLAGVAVATVIAPALALMGCSSDNDPNPGVISPPQIAPTPEIPVPSPSSTSPGVAPGPEPSSPPSTSLTLKRIATGLSEPLFLTSPPGDPDALFVVEQRTGNIKIVDRDTGTIEPTPFLTVPASDLIATGYEQGLLGLAFHPDYETNGLLYINYTAPGQGDAGQTQLIEYRALTPTQADPSSARTILTLPQPDQNHNGGWMDFDQEGYLYWATGDGGGLGFLSSGIKVFSRNSQDTTDNLLGKILRIDVDGDDFPDDPERNYRIPADNPFVGSDLRDDEIWVYGLRNPWRASFDPATGDLYIGDVGQDTWEEINVQPATSPGGENYGWAIREGTLDLEPVPDPLDLVEPTYQFPQNNGQSVTGGYVYRGSNPFFEGRYIYGVFSSPAFGPSQILSFRYTGTDVEDPIDHTPELNPDVGSLDLLGSFGRDGEGHLYALDLDGEIFQLVIEPIEPIQPIESPAPMAPELPTEPTPVP